MTMASFIVLSAALIGAIAHWVADMAITEYRIRVYLRGFDLADQCEVKTIDVRSKSELSSLTTR